MRSVASAIEGAAQNKPAKLFGRNASPNAAKAETAIPPVINRKRYSNKGVASQDFTASQLSAETFILVYRLVVFSHRTLIGIQGMVIVRNFINLPAFTKMATSMSLSRHARDKGLIYR